MDYKMLDSGKIDPKWKCPIDLLRYYCDMQEEWTNEFDESGNRYRPYDDYDAICDGRKVNNTVLTEDRW
jgi:hypothetical protein